MSGLEVGQLLNLAISRSRLQERLEPPVARFQAYRIVLNTGTANYKAVPVGYVTAVQTHRKISAQKFTDKQREVTAQSFELICGSQEFAAEWRDKDVVAAAVQWCRFNAPRGHAIHVVNDALMAVLTSAHGCPAAGGRGDFDLLRAQSYLEMKPLTAVEGSAAA